MLSWSQPIRKNVYVHSDIRPRLHLPQATTINHQHSNKSSIGFVNAACDESTTQVLFIPPTRRVGCIVTGSRSRHFIPVKEELTSVTPTWKSKPLSNALATEHPVPLYSVADD
jgi:hypothetical protein